MLLKYVMGGGSGDDSRGDGMAGGEAMAAVGRRFLCHVVRGEARRDAGSGGVLLQNVFGLHGADQEGRGKHEKRGESFHSQRAFPKSDD